MHQDLDALIDRARRAHELRIITSEQLEAIADWVSKEVGNREEAVSAVAELFDRPGHWHEEDPAEEL